MPAGFAPMSKLLTDGVAHEVIGGVPVTAVTRQENARLTVDLALAARHHKGPPQISTSVNGQVLALLSSRRHARHTAELLREAAIINADGQPLIFASRWLGHGRVRERCATTDVFHDVANIAIRENVSFYMLGASPEENRLAVAAVRRRYPSLNLLGARHGYFASQAEEQAAIAEIDALKPDILWLAMGFPRELEFAVAWSRALTNVGVIKTSGGLFNFLSGTRSRAPVWMQNAGLEWAYRLMLEPRRLFLRYATTNVIAAWLLVTRTERQQT